MNDIHIFAWTKHAPPRIMFWADSAASQICEVAVNESSYDEVSVLTPPIKGEASRAAWAVAKKRSAAGQYHSTWEEAFDWLVATTAESVRANTGRLERASDRMDALHTLGRKHGMPRIQTLDALYDLGQWRIDK